MDKRFLLWILLSTALLVALFSAQHFLFPNKGAQLEPQTKVESAKFIEQVPALLGGFGNTPGHVLVPTDLLSPQALLKKAEEVAEAKRQAAAREAERQAAALPPDETIELGANDDALKLQVVFSKHGGAIKTITLKSKRDDGPYVHRSATREFAEPMNTPLTLVNDDDDGKFDKQSMRERLHRQSFRFQVEGVDLKWAVREQAGNKVVFAAEVPGKNVTVVRTFEVKPGEYHVTMQLDLQFHPGAQGDFIYEITGPRGLPVEGMAWKRASFRQVVVGTVDGKDRTIAQRKLVDPGTINPGFGANPEPIRPANEKRETQYAGVMIQYFGALLVIDGDPTQARYIDAVTPEYLGDDDDFPKGTEKLQGKVTARVTSRPIFAEPGATVTHNYLVFAGPVKVRLLKNEPGVAPGLAERYEDELHLNLLTDAPGDYALARWLAYLGWNTMVVFFTNVMHWLLHFLVSITGHYGIAIILLTLIVRAAMFPVSRKQALASQRMQKLAPELKKLQEKYKDKKEELMKAQMQLYRQHGVNPMSGCLVILLQMPVFLGLYYALYESINLRLAGFLWIDNLAVPDALYNWQNIWGLRWLGDAIHLGPTFNILPLISVVLMVIQQRWMTPPAIDDQQKMQMKMMNFMMIFMAYMFYWVPAGLCVYFIVSGAWGMLERKLLPKISHASDKAPPEARSGTTPRGRKPSPNGSNGVLGSFTHWWSELLKKAEKK